MPNKRILPDLGKLSPFSRCAAKIAANSPKPKIRALSFRGSVKYILSLTAALLAGCSASWSDGPYEIYQIDGVRTLGFRLGESAYIGRIDEPKNINANEKYISVYACPEAICAYYYIDRIKDHKFADSTEFVYGPYTKKAFTQLQNRLLLPELGSK